MKKKENDSILYIVKKTLRKNQRNFMAMSFLFVLIIGYFLWTLNGIQAQNTQVREAVYGLELSNRNSQLCVMQLCLAQNEESREKYSAQGDGYDMEIQEQVKLLRGLMPEESERLGRIQELLQSAFQERQRMIINASAQDDGESGAADFRAGLCAENAGDCRDLYRAVTEGGTGEQRAEPARGGADDGVGCRSFGCHHFAGAA